MSAGCGSIGREQSDPAPLQSNIMSRWSRAKLPAPVSQGHKMYCLGPKRGGGGGGRGGAGLYPGPTFTQTAG